MDRIPVFGQPITFREFLGDLYGGAGAITPILIQVLVCGACASARVVFGVVTVFVLVAWHVHMFDAETGVVTFRLQPFRRRARRICARVAKRIATFRARRRLGPRFKAA